MGSGPAAGDAALGARAQQYEQPLTENAAHAAMCAPAAGDAALGDRVWQYKQPLIDNTEHAATCSAPAVRDVALGSQVRQAGVPGQVGGQVQGTPRGVRVHGQAPAAGSQ